MTLKPYKGRVSALAELGSRVEGSLSLNTWREGKDIRRVRAIRELARRLERSGIKWACGPVLSGALFAQAISDASNGIHAGFLRKPGYKMEKHALNPLPHGWDRWVFVDDVIQHGRSLIRASKEITLPPEAVIVLDIFDWDPLFPKHWNDVPVLMLKGRKRS